MKGIFYTGSVIMVIVASALSILLAQPDNIILNNIKIFQVKERSPVAGSCSITSVPVMSEGIRSGVN